MNKNNMHVALVAIGMIGLFAQIEYSGWVLLLGILGIIFDGEVKNDYISI